MKPMIALLALFIVACGGGDSSVGPTGPAGPTGPTGPTLPTQVDGGQLFTYGNAVAFLPSGIAQYKAAIVFLPGLRDPATGTDLDSRDLVRGTSGGGCSIWCSPAERAEVWSRALALVGGNVALIGTTTLVDTPASYDTLLTALSDFGTQSQHPELASLACFSSSRSSASWLPSRETALDWQRMAKGTVVVGAC